MFDLLPVPRIRVILEGSPRRFIGIELDTKRVKGNHGDLRSLLVEMLWNHPGLTPGSGRGAETLSVVLVDNLPADTRVTNRELFHSQGYTLEVSAGVATLQFETRQGCINGMSTLVQLINPEGGNRAGSGDAYGSYTIPGVRIVDWPSVEVRGISPTFAWYAGYGRLGFDTQLWGYDEWAEFLHVCADFKINQVNLCMYGYWPFEMPEYPETVLKGFPMKVWNRESRNWITIQYMHPNVAQPFLPRLIETAHTLGIRVFAYIGLNSYNGGYAAEHREKRMRLPPDSRYVNDFDTLCLSDPTTTEYLKTCVSRVVGLGFDGIVFEESEESLWFCTCPKCRAEYLEGRSPAEAKHVANYRLLKSLHGVIKAANPACVVGLRAWREPPLEKSPEYLRTMVDSIPPDVVLFWAPGLYVPQEEFAKWVAAFGKERIWARDAEANGVSSCLGRLIRIFRSNGLRCDEEANDQYLEEDIEQHRGTVLQGARGINGYLFEWYGFFIHLFAHAFYGWGSTMPAEEFYGYSIGAVFGPECAKDILFCLRSLFTIHESQVGIFPTEFPFARNKVEDRDEPRIRRAIDEWPVIREKLESVRSRLEERQGMRIWLPHFDKLIVAHRRNRVIYDLALASLEYQRAKDPGDRRRWLLRMRDCNRDDFALVRDNYFDVNPVSRTGTRSCMIPCHELERVIGNELHPDDRDDVPIYLGVEALGWLWL